MPVIPSFNSFAPVPRLAETKLGYERLDLERRKLQQDALESQQRQQLARQELDQRRVQAEMEMAVKMQDLVQQHLLNQQQLEMKRAYDKASLGLASDRISRQQQADQMRNALGLATLEQRGQLGTQRIEIDRQRMQDAGDLAWERIQESRLNQGEKAYEFDQQNTFNKAFQDYLQKNPDASFEDATKVGIGAAGLYRQAAQITGRAQGTGGEDRVEERSINRERRAIVRKKVDDIRDYLEKNAIYVPRAIELRKTGKPDPHWDKTVKGQVELIAKALDDLDKALAELGAIYATPEEKPYVPRGAGTNAPAAYSNAPAFTVPRPTGTNRIVRAIR